MRSIYSIWLLLIVSATSNAGLIHSTTPDQAYLDHAELVAQSVVYTQRQNFDGNFQFGGSGVKVGDNWILASSHQVHAIDWDLSSRYPGFRVGTGNNYLNSPGTIYNVLEVHIHPTYRDLLYGYDLALFRVDQPIEGIPTAKLFTGDIQAGMDIHIAGYGLTGQIGVTYPAYADGNLRAGTNVLTGVPWSSIGDPFFGYGTIGGQGSQRYRTLGYQALSGDSGGGFFFEVDGEYHLGGITSAGNATADTHRYGFSTVATRIDRDWVMSTIAAVPEPSGFTLVLVSCCLSFALRLGARTRLRISSHC